MLKAAGLLSAIWIAPAAAGTIEVFGDARIGLGYNINNNGTLQVKDDGDGGLEPGEELRAISRVRFGVTMTGESDSGIAFGATIRADNSGAGQGGTLGQRAGNVFASGAFGTLTYGDVDGADLRRVGNIDQTTGRTGLTQLGEQDDTLFLSNGGGSGPDEDGVTAGGDRNARPSLRYDFDLERLGFSVSTDRDLGSVVVGAGYSAEIGPGALRFGLGYADIESYGTPSGGLVPDTEQYSAGLSGRYGSISGAAFYLLSDGADGSEIEQAVFGAAYDRAGLRINGWYNRILTAKGEYGFGALPQDDALGIGASYALGPGASLIGGYVRDFASNDRADFGIALRF